MDEREAHFEAQFGSQFEAQFEARFEALCRGFLSNAAARQAAVANVDPEAPTVDYLTGFGAGWEAGHVAALALVVSMLSGESATTLIENAQAEAAIETAFPFELHIVDDVLGGDAEAAA